MSNSQPTQTFLRSFAIVVETPCTSPLALRLKPIALQGPASGQRVASLPAIRHTVPAWSRPADPGRRFIPGPASRRASSDQAHCACLVATSRSGPADHHQPARHRAPSGRAQCAHLVATGRSGPAGSDRRIRADGYWCARVYVFHNKCQKLDENNISCAHIHTEIVNVFANH